MTSSYVLVAACRLSFHSVNFYNSQRFSNLTVFELLSPPSTSAVSSLPLVPFFPSNPLNPKSSAFFLFVPAALHLSPSSFLRVLSTLDHRKDVIIHWLKPNVFQGVARNSSLFASYFRAVFSVIGRNVFEMTEKN